MGNSSSYVSATSRSPYFWAAAAVLFVSFVHAWTNPSFFYWDDVQHAHMPVFYEIGERLRSGDWPTATLLSWEGGNLVGEGQYQLFNPLSLALFALLPSIDDLRVAAFLYSTFYLVLAATGCVRLALRLGATASWSAAAGMSYALAPFMLYWQAASWVNGLVACAAIPWALSTLIKPDFNSRDAVLLAFSTYLTGVSGWVHGQIALLVYAVSYFIASCRDPDSRRRLAASGMAMCAAAIASLPALLATMAAVGASSRQVAYLHDGTLSAQLADHVWSYWPTYRSLIRWGLDPAFVQPSPPITYAAWFIVPAAGILMATPRRSGALAAWLLAGTAVLALLSLGPSQFGPVRWPLRFLPLVQLGTICLASVVLSRDLPAADTRRALGISGVMLLVGFGAAAQQTPEDIALHAFALALLSGLTILVFRRFRSGASKAGQAAAISVVVLSALVAMFFKSSEDLLQWHAPAARPAGGGTSVRNDSRLLAYSVHVDDRRPRGADLQAWPSGNTAWWSGGRTVNGYSPVAPLGLTRLLCSNAWGWTCIAAPLNVLRREPSTGATYLDLMRITRVDMMRSQRPHAYPPGEAPAGWEEVPSGNSVSWLREKANGLPPGTTASWTSPGYRLSRILSVSDDEEQVVVDSDGTVATGLLAFARPPYPGTRIEVDGKKAELVSLGGVAFAVRLTAGTKGQVVTIVNGMPHAGIAGTAVVLAALLLAASMLLGRSQAASSDASRNRQGRRSP